MSNINTGRPARALRTYQRAHSQSRGRFIQSRAGRSDYNLLCRSSQLDYRGNGGISPKTTGRCSEIVERFSKSIFRSFFGVRAARKLGQVTSDTTITDTVNATCEIARAIFVVSFASTLHSDLPSRSLQSQISPFSQVPANSSGVFKSAVYELRQLQVRKFGRFEL